MTQGTPNAPAVAHCTPVDLFCAYRLVNHGPTVLVSAAHGDARNIMAAAWNMPLDFDPPRVAVVLDKSTWTRQLVEASGEFVLSVPTQAQADLVQTIGTTSGKDLVDRTGQDKFKTLPVPFFQVDATPAPLPAGCVAWLACRVLPEPHLQSTYDIFLGEVTAAWADDRVFRDGQWQFEGHDDLRTIHHVAGGHYLVDGKALIGQSTAPD